MAWWQTEDVVRGRRDGRERETRFTDDDDGASRQNAPSHHQVGRIRARRVTVVNAVVV